MTRAMMALCGFLLVSPALAQTPELKKTDVGGQPTGEGDPDAMVCRRPMQIPNSRMLGPKVCKKNAVWAQYREDRMMVSEDGTHDVAVKTQNCRASGGDSGGGGSSTSMARGMGGGVVCE